MRPCLASDRRPGPTALLVLLALLPVAAAVGRTAAAAAGAASISGSVTTLSGEPLADATVRLLPPEIESRTDGHGRFRFGGLSPGRYEIVVGHVGFGSLAFAVEIGDAGVAVDVGAIALTGAVPVLDPVRVEAERRSPRLAATGFYERRDAGIGAFVERAAIDAWQPREVTDILRHVPGVRIEPNPDYGRPLEPQRSVFGYAVGRSRGPDTRRLLIYSPRAPNAEQCPPLFFIDGTFLGSALTVDIDAAYSAASVEAVEFYAGPGRLPSQFNRPGAQCGVFLLWSRAGR